MVESNSSNVAVVAVMVRVMVREEAREGPSVEAGVVVRAEKEEAAFSASASCASSCEEDDTAIEKVEFERDGEEEEEEEEVARTSFLQWNSSTVG